MCFSECPRSTGVWMLEWKCHLALGVSFHQQYQVCRPSPSAAHPPLGEWFGLVLAPDQGQLGAIPSPPPPASWCCAAQIPSVSPNLPFCSKRLSHRFAFESSREAVQQERERSIGTIQAAAVPAMAWAQELMRTGLQQPPALVLEANSHISKEEQS